jgi:uncharacterized membrane protein
MNVTNLIGHFHPLLVHLPIGILVLSILVSFVSRFERWVALQSSVSFILFWGSFTAVFSCISGYLLSLNGDYDTVLLQKHQWTGIALALVSTLAWLFQRFSKKENKVFQAFLGLALGGLLVVVGHYGGSLTHGTGYLTEGVFEKIEKPKMLEKMTDSLQNSVLQTALNAPILPKDSPKTRVEIHKTASQNPIILKDKTVSQVGKMTISTPLETSLIVEKPVFIYQDLIKPILEQRCYSCHGAHKSKGDLRLDSPEFIKQGGENGVVLVAGNSEKSSLYTSLLLPVEDDAHMPPEGKPQMTEQQIQLIRFWIEKGAFFDKTIHENLIPSTPNTDTLKNRKH